MLFVYEFDDWREFDLALARIAPLDANMRGPVVLQSLGEVPEQYRFWGQW